MRLIVIDTETTGFLVKDGHRVVEIGAVEIIDGKLTGKNFHKYINPERNIPEDATKVHGITDEQVARAPKFKDIVDEFIDFIQGATLIAHNSSFDESMLNMELGHANKGDLWAHVPKIIDSLKLSKELNPEFKTKGLNVNGVEVKGGYSLDKLCERWGVSTEAREFHGALLDSELLADVYLKMIEGREDIELDSDVEQINWVRPEIQRFDASLYNLKSVNLDASDEVNHANQLEKLGFTQSKSLKM
jgi:DNA polymerase III subunit epsilon